MEIVSAEIIRNPDGTEVTNCVVQPIYYAQWEGGGSITVRMK